MLTALPSDAHLMDDEQVQTTLQDALVRVCG